MHGPLNVGYNPLYNTHPTLLYDNTCPTLLYDNTRLAHTAV